MSTREKWMVEYVCNTMPEWKRIYFNTEADLDNWLKSKFVQNFKRRRGSEGVIWPPESFPHNECYTVYPVWYNN